MQDVNVATDVDEDLGHSAIPDVHSGDQGIIVREKNGVDVYVREGDRPTQGRGWAPQDHSTGHVNVNDPLLRDGALYQGGDKDDVYFPIVDEGLSRLAL